MRTILPAAAILSILFTVRLLAQAWSVDLDDITNRDATVDRIRAESVEFMPDGTTLAIAGHFYDGRTQTAVAEVRILSALNGSLTSTLRGTGVTYSLRAGSLALSPSAQRIAAAGRNGKKQSIVDVFDLSSMKLAVTLEGDPYPTTCVTFSPDGKVLAAAQLNGTVDLWDHHTGKLTATFVAHADGIWPIAFSPDGSMFAIGNGDVSVSVLNAHGTQGLARVPSQSDLDALGSVVFSPDSKLLAIGGSPSNGSDSPVYIWELNVTKKDGEIVGAKQKARLQGHREHTYSLAFSPDGNLLASANQDTTVRIWDVHANDHFRPITAHKDFVYDVAFSPDGAALVTLGRDSLKLWTVKQLRDRQRTTVNR